MKILLVEDNQQFLEETLKEIEKVAGEGSVLTASNKAAACEIIETEFFDLIVLDLNLPSTDDSLDADGTHGQEVFHFCITHAPGTPICFLTGSSTHRFVNQLLNTYANRQDFWGQGELTTSPMVFQKLYLVDFLKYLEQCFGKLKKLSDIELRPVSSGQSLTLDAQRLLKMFTIKLCGSSCKWQDLKGGLSNVRVLSVEVLNLQDASLFKAVGRIGKREKISLESDNFDLMVPALTIGTFPSKLSFIEYGAKSSAAIYYRLATEHRSNLSELLLDHTEESLETYSKLKEIFSVWGEACVKTRKPLGTLIRCLITDTKLNEIKNNFELEWLQDIDDLSVPVKWARTHGDLHGGNVLVGSDFRPLIIDFGDLAERATSLDPCSALLSPFFHSDTAQRAVTLCSTLDLLKSIEDLTCGLDTPFALFFNQIKQWIFEECSGSARGIYSSILVYALRQLNYADTDKELALSIIEICRRRIIATT